MIVKKPYAFLIKHFKAIHLMLAIAMLYLLYKTNGLYTFFNGYVKNGFYEYNEQLATTYINFYVFVVIIVLLLLTSFIYLLMRWKKKSRLLYITISIFYFALFIGFLANFSILDNLATKVHEIRTIKAFRDISLMMYAPQFIFITLITIRAIGFDIKKFDFKKDLAELDIAEEDQEEIEVTFGQNNYKVLRFLRRAKREFKYYVLENKVFLTMMIGIVVLITGFSVFLNVAVYKKTYNESDMFQVDGIYFNVQNSIVTDTDLKGNTINKDKKYMVVYLNINNKTKARNSLDTRNLRLMVDGKNYYPTYSLSEYFKDLGETYYKNTLYPSEEYTYLLLYEIPKKTDHTKAIFRMMDSVNLINGELKAKYKDTKLSPTEYIKDDNYEQYDILDVVDFADSTLLNSEITINSYEIGNEFTEKYQYCYGKDCYARKKIIAPNIMGSGSSTVLKINATLKIDNNLYLNKYIKTLTDFIKHFASVSIVNGKEEKTIKANIIESEHIAKENAYIELDKSIIEAQSAFLNITVRNKKYKIKLK